jgi:hypothetical protein
MRKEEGDMKITLHNESFLFAYSPITVSIFYPKVLRKTSTIFARYKDISSCENVVNQEGQLPNSITKIFEK